MLIAIDSEYDEITKKPFIVTMADHQSSKLLYPNNKKDYYIIKQICESRKIKKIFHSATSDIYALSTIGININPPYHDTFIMSSIIDENFSSRKLKILAKKYLREPCEEQKELNKIKLKYKRKYGKKFSWSLIPKKIIEPYAVKDAEYTYNLFKYFEPKIKQYKKLYKLELKLVPMIVNMQKRGHNINREFCKQEILRLQESYNFYFKKLIKFNNKIFNIQSPKDLRSLLKKTDIDFIEKTPTGLVKTGKDILEPLVKENKVIKWVLYCRSAHKQINTYYEPLLNNYTSEKNSIAHFSFYQSGTKSGRFSAELIQTIPKESSNIDLPNNVRKAFIPRKNFINLYFDYNQIEMRLFAHFTKNKTLIRAVLNGVDLHTATAIDLFNKSDKESRRISKTINFGMIYGMGGNALKKKLDMPLRKANEILSVYDQKYRIKAFISEMSSLLYRQGYVNLDWIGREYRVPRELAYKCVNIIIQGSAAYVIKLAMKRLKKYIESVLSLNLLLQLHDELIFEIHESELSQKIIMDIKNIMEDYTTFVVPITVSVEYSENSWLNKKKWKFI